jgi:hypothetical protein
MKNNSAENNKDNKVEKKKLEDLEKKIKKPRLKLDDKALLYSENGLKKYFDILDKTEFKESTSEIGNLNKLVQIFKNWHFMLMPKYDIDYFSNKIQEIGKKNSGRVSL